MLSRTKADSGIANHDLAHLLVYESTRHHVPEVVALLQARGYRATPAESADEATSALESDRPEVLLLLGDEPDGRGSEAVRQRAASLGIPLLAVVDPSADPDLLADRLEGADDWVSIAGLSTELPIRLARLLRVNRRKTLPRRSTLELRPQLLEMIVHDLRSPLSAIGLCMVLIRQSVPKSDPELHKDLRDVEENFRQITLMLTQLSDYYCLFDPRNPLLPTEFNPARLVDAEIENRLMRHVPVTLEETDDCPREVTLDPTRARLALQYILANATVSSSGDPVRVVLKGGPDRWVTEVVVESPPPSSVTSLPLTSSTFDRLCGIAAQRRGMELAIAAKISEMFGGSARLEVEPGQRSTIVLDWPSRLGDSSE